MTDSPEIKAADAKLEDAIQNILHARGLAVDGAILGDYMVIASQTRFDDDGDACTSVVFVSPTGPARYRLLGLLEETKHRLLDGDWGDDDD